MTDKPREPQELQVVVDETQEETGPEPFFPQWIEFTPEEEAVIEETQAIITRWHAREMLARGEEVPWLDQIDLSIEDPTLEELAWGPGAKGPPEHELALDIRAIEEAPGDDEDEPDEDDDSSIVDY